MTKVLTIRLTLPVDPDEFGLHAISPEVRAWLAALRTDAERHGCTVAVEVEDAKGLVRVRKRTRGPGKPKPPVVSLVPHDAA